MSPSPADDFDIPALYSAIDAQRQSRGLTWPEAIREMQPISRSTVTGLRSRAAVEGDGILQMLRWLNRAPESFVRGIEVRYFHKLPAAAAGGVLRFDSAKLYTALDRQRIARGLTWQQVGREIGGAASLARLKKGGRIGFPGVMRLTRWLEQPAAHFVRIADR